MLFRGSLLGVLVGEKGHFVALAWDGTLVSSSFGELSVHSVEGAVEGVVCRTPDVQEVWYFFLLPPEGAVGEWESERELTLDLPCWDWRIGRRRLYPVVEMRVVDLSAHRTPMRAFGPCLCMPSAMLSV